MERIKTETHSSRIGPTILFVLTSLVVVGIVFWFAGLWERAMRRVDNALQPATPVMQSADFGQRIYLEDDPYYWVSFAQEMAETGHWRIRHTQIDNTPYGREMQWSQSFSWLLVFSGWVRHCVTGETMTKAIEGGSIWINPALLVFVTLGFSWLIYRRMGAMAASLFAVTLISVGNIGWTFHPFRPDHQGLHVAVAFGALFCLVLGGLGWVQVPPPGGTASRSSRRKHFQPLMLTDRRSARRYFLGAGILTGLGLWIGATVQFFNLVAIVGGCVAMVFLTSKRSGTAESESYVPELWRWWSIPAALTAAVFYLVEYFPNHLAVRLEVNNPILPASLLCAGELMVCLARWRLGDRKIGPAGWIKVGALILGAGGVPLLFVFGPADWHSMRAVEMRRLYEFISELQSFSNFSKGNALERWLQAFGLLPFFLIGAVWQMRAWQVKVHEWAALCVTFWVCVIYSLLTLWQIRWAGIYAASVVWLMILVGHVTWRRLSQRHDTRNSLVPAIVGILLVLAQAGFFIHRSYVAVAPVVRGTGLLDQIVDEAMKKRLATGLARSKDGQPLRVLCEPDLAAALHYFGGNSSVVSYYHENLQGLRDATDFFTDPGDSVAREVARKRGLSLLLVSDDAQLPVTFNYIRTGNKTSEAARSTLLARLQQNRTRELPRWIVLDKELTAIGRRRFVYHGATGTAAIESRVTVYQLEPRTSH